MKKLTLITLAVLILTSVAPGQGNQFKRIRYQGGTLTTATKPDDWGNSITITSDEITLKLKDGQAMTLKPGQVTGLSYGQEAHRRVGTMVALSLLTFNPIPLFGLLHKKRNHYIGVEFATEGDKKGAWLLQADKDNYRALLVTLHGTTGAKLSVAPEDRKHVVGIDVDEVLREEKKKNR